MAGNLSFEMRENNSGGDWTEIFNVTVNGAFSIQHFLNASDVNVAAGILEVRMRFYPDLYESTDDANLTTGDPYALVGILNFEVIATPQLRESQRTFWYRFRITWVSKSDLLYREITPSFDGT